MTFLSLSLSTLGGRIKYPKKPSSVSMIFASTLTVDVYQAYHQEKGRSATNACTNFSRTLFSVQQSRCLRNLRLPFSPTSSTFGIVNGSARNTIATAGKAESLGSLRSTTRFFTSPLAMESSDSCYSNFYSISISNRDFISIGSCPPFQSRRSSLSAQLTSIKCA